MPCIRLLLGLGPYAACSPLLRAQSAKSHLLTRPKPLEAPGVRRQVAVHCQCHQNAGAAAAHQHTLL